MLFFDLVRSVNSCIIFLSQKYYLSIDLNGIKRNSLF